VKSELTIEVGQLHGLVALISLLCIVIPFGGCKQDTYDNSREKPKSITSPVLGDVQPDTPGTIDAPKIRIAGGSEYTATTDVDINFSVMGAVEMYITNSAGCTEGGEWELYTTKKPWVLAQTNTTATVYAKFKSREAVESPCASDTILHDDTGPIIVSDVDDGAGTISRTTTPVATWEPANDGYGVGVKSYEIAVGTEQGKEDVFPWTNIGKSTTYAADGLELTAGSVYFSSVRAFDLADNIGPVKSGDGWKVVEWQQQAYVKASNAKSHMSFGSAVAIHRDRMVVGVEKEPSGQTTITNGATSPDDTTKSSSGAVFVYRRNVNEWVQEAFLKAPNSFQSDLFGTSVAMTHDTIVVGAPGEASNQTTIINGTSASSDRSAQNAGAVYVFRRTGVTWVQEAYLKATNAEAGDRFGSAVAISGDLVVVGATGESSSADPADNSVPGSGAAYVFKRDGTTWEQVGYLKASNADENDAFGNAVAVSEDIVAVGAKAEQSAERIIVNNDYASDDNSATNAGAVYIFGPQGTSWIQRAYIKAINAEAGDRFGHSVAMSGTTLVVGAYEEDGPPGVINGVTSAPGNTNVNSGAAYVYELVGDKWKPTAYLKASNANDIDNFGYHVSIHNDKIVVGAVRESSGSNEINNLPGKAANDRTGQNSGAVFVFKRVLSKWHQEAYIKAVNNDKLDWFGSAVGIFDDTIVSGAIYEKSNQRTITNGKGASSDNSVSGAGAVYIYSLY